MLIVVGHLIQQRFMEVIVGKLILLTGIESAVRVFNQIINPFIQLQLNFPFLNMLLLMIFNFQVNLHQIFVNLGSVQRKICCGGGGAFVVRRSPPDLECSDVGHPS